MHLKKINFFIPKRFVAENSVPRALGSGAEVERPQIVDDLVEQPGWKKLCGLTAEASKLKQGYLEVKIQREKGKKNSIKKIIVDFIREDTEALQANIDLAAQFEGEDAVETAQKRKSEITTLLKELTDFVSDWEDEEPDDEYDDDDHVGISPSLDRLTDVVTGMRKEQLIPWMQAFQQGDREMVQTVEREVDNYLAEAQITLDPERTEKAKSFLARTAGQSGWDREKIKQAAKRVIDAIVLLPRGTFLQENWNQFSRAMERSVRDII